ncbi:MULTISPECIES: NupC/NupG family nucleoside CNT transporter [unclassified Hyphomonas]|jgi:CNT family concentrative nucleoside transporter|uniref:Nucleoside permease NupC n=4 Tax=root TaxID=1 RepID=A0A160U0I6_9ZZZZ|nr:MULTISPECIES: nucleoside transporter C-terminal domain-containing protein [unclassified Hyphomonas]MAA81786.1 nucleoside transporter [Hyphomonas sp.]MAL43632.1 nucleoside transporter [Hyphomonas sp.]MAX82928.1 nucleoside transporter [Hyphomonas sp.]MBO6582894.1 nucleoside transporter [Hyphomonas sp.]MDF1805344.1 nucleoside transporter C-terminal domain-containing protein [Hyphomonas sp.]|tara:strand:+ start:1915 stop:3216 length:1302 start_codon:yes stop_codon:yes gene_type:complete
MLSIAGYEWGWDNARALLGILLIYGVCWVLSEKRKLFPFRLIIGATIMQFVFALILFGIPFVRAILFKANDVVDGLQNATRAGTSFVFGYVGDNVAAQQLMDGSPPPLFFFQILPIVIVVAALSAILWHWRILQWVTNGFAYIFQRAMGLGGATSLAVSANVFMGMTEAPVLIRPYIKGMTRSELLIMMTAGFATIAGSVLVVYGAFLEGKMDNPLAQLLTASIMAAPAAVAVALCLIPETTPATERMKEPDFSYSSTMDAFSTGASDGLKIVLNIATMLIAALALLWLVNAGLGAFPDVAGAPLSIERILGWIFAPLMYMIGVPMGEAAQSGSLMGVKTVLTEFVAFLQLAEVPQDAMDPRTRIITAHAICGFANFGSMGILIGGLSIVEPARRDDFLALAWRTLLAGTLATCLSGAVVGALPYQLFAGVGG